ncbi:MAG: UvrD-helicase domain-containing protein [Bacteroidales bacterium]|nr:UvrD-helicase domain-containing protein [Bacteroidales bacterium]
MNNLDTTQIPDAERDDEREQLLSAFLTSVNMQKLEADEKSKVAQSNIALSEYSASATETLPDVIKEKIKHLQSIVRSIEEKPVVVIDEHVFDKKFKINYHERLNKSQLAAIATVSGPLLVIAGAGSGKTRVIIHRLSYLLELGVSPQEILLLTFTKKASKEMLGRAEELLQNKLVAKVMGGTFHSFANHILRKYANLLDLPHNFSIIDTSDSQDTIDLIRSELKFGQTDKAFPKKARIQEVCSSARNRNLTIKEVIETDFTGIVKYTKDIELIYRGYGQYKTICKLFDYDDLMEVLRDKLKQNLVFREKIQDLYRFIMVDEFQDTNLVQKDIVDFIAQKHRNIMVVGDDAQSIYAFRGANFENILRFPETYPDCKVVKIEQNYRSNQTILNFTNAIISNAVLGYPKKLYSENNTQFKPIIKKFYNQEEEAEYIVSVILQLRERAVELKNMAVLCRSTWHWHHIEFELQKRGIPYITVGGLAFHEKLHVKDLIAYLRLTQNPYDAVAWHRILKLIPGIGKTASGTIIKDVMQNSGKISLEKYNTKQYSGALQLLANTLMTAADSNMSVKERISLIKEYYIPILQSRENDFAVRILDLNVLEEMSAKYETLELFLSDFALDPPSKKYSDRTTPMTDEDEEKPLTLSTVHSAKGLEWFAVFVPHALDGLFPNSKALNSIEEVEEERRLFYVACSRAKEELYITMPSYVKTFNAFCSYPSRFIVEIDKENYRM